MNLTCSSKLIKYLMLVFNFLFVITGIILLGLGVSVKAYYYQYDTFLDDKYFSLPNMLIATGSLIFFISFLGCYGAMKENWVLLVAFSVLLGIIFIFELSVGIAGYVLRNKTSAYLESKLTESMAKYVGSEEIHKMWDIIQDEFECCGVFNYTDWESVFNNVSLPLSCCPRTSGTIGVFYCNANIIPTTAPTSATTPSTKPTEKTENPAESAKLVKEGDDATTGELSSSSSENTVATDSTTDKLISSTTDPATVTTDPTTVATDPTTVATDSTTAESTITDVTTLSSVSTESTTVTEATVTESSSVSTEIVTNSTTPAVPPSTSSPYSIGCESAFGSFIKAHAVDIGGAAIAIAVIQFVGVLFSCHLARQLKNGYYST